MFILAFLFSLLPDDTHVAQDCEHEIRVDSTAWRVLRADADDDVLLLSSGHSSPRVSVQYACRWVHIYIIT